jgi:hypothetical protein
MDIRSKGRRRSKAAPGLIAGALMLATAAGAHATVAPPPPVCNLGNGIKNVVYIEFDNVHFTRDNPNVPSDIEQMPNLENFITSNGTLDAGDHTVLISHTANDILTTETGLYSDDDGIFVANSFLVFDPAEVAQTVSSFFYWTDLVNDINSAADDNAFALTTPEGENVPAPWVPFTRAGCDVGAFSTANIVLERTPFDVDQVFGAGSPQAMESSSQQTNDFVGAAIHCTKGSPFCTPENNAVADLLPDEPGGYSGYEALFGLKYIAPALGGITDYNGNPITGFAAIDFDPVPAQTLAVVETMLKQGIHVVFAYIADAHDNQAASKLSTAEGSFGPGEAPYVRQLAQYNAAFGKFFADLKAAGIDQTNTLFIFTPDEGDHPVVGPPVPANCDGATVVGSTVTPDIACTYPTGEGELDEDLGQEVLNAGDNTPFNIHFDDSATTYVTGNPADNSAEVRKLERVMAGLKALDPENGQEESLLGTGLGPDKQGAIVDRVAQRLLHMNTVADENRSPTFTFFGNPDFFFETTSKSCVPPPNPNPTCGTTTGIIGPSFIWNHGDIQPEIARTFIAIAGPGVRNLGITTPQQFFTDHVDVRPTIMTLTGLTDDYAHDGRTITELVDPSVLPAGLRNHLSTAEALGQVLKKIDAPFGELAQDTLKVSTAGITSNTPADAEYNLAESLIASWTAERDPIASAIKQQLEGAEFDGNSINEVEAAQLIVRANILLGEAQFWSSAL